MEFFRIGDEVVSVEQKGRDLVRMDIEGWRETARCRGEGAGDEDDEFGYTGMYTGCEQAYPWVKGDKSVTIIHPETFSETRIPGFFDEGTALSCIISPLSKNLMATCRQFDGSFGFIFSDRQEIRQNNQQDCLPLGAYVIRLELSMDDRLFFAGGTIPAGGGSAPALFALTFASPPLLLSALTLNLPHNRPGSVPWVLTSLKRCRDKQVLVGGSQGTIWISEWTGDSLVMLNWVPGVTNGPVTGIDIVESDQKIVVSGSEDFHVTEIVFVV